jgi:hypothetical protein
MLDEFVSFNDKKMPDPSMVLKPKKEKIYKPPPLPNKNLEINNQKKSINDLEGEEELKKIEEETLKLLKEQEALTLAEQVLRRQQEEQEAKKREILKQLHKNRNVDLNKFITRSVGYEQKKNYDLEQKRFKKLEEESKLCKEKPLLSNKTIQICKTLKKKPIYERAKEIIEKREKKLQLLKNNKNYNKKVKKINKSMDDINKHEKRKRKEYIINEKIKNKKMNYKEMINYYNWQNDWKNRLEERNKIGKKEKKKQKEKELVDYFHPHISQGSIEIINAKNETNENYRRHNTDDYNNNYYYYADNDIYNINNGKNVYDRLYEENIIYEIRKNENRNKLLCSFQPFTNRNKYKEIQPKYNEIKGNKMIIKKRRNKKKMSIIKENKSVEINRKKDEENDDKKEINEPWTNTLFKLKKDKSQNYKDKDISYRLNIRQASAWNENDINIVPYRGESREIVKYFI